MAEVIGNSELANRALAAQVASRLRPAIATDAMLVTPIVTRSHSDTPEFNAVGVLEMSRDQIAKAQEFLRKKAVGRKYKEGISEQVARQVLELQSSRCMTNFSIAKTSNTKYLPGGVPLIDHLHVRVDNSVDWKCLVEPIDALRHHRLPRSSDISAVKEFTLGHSEERHVHAALEYLSARLRNPRRLTSLYSWLQTPSQSASAERTTIKFSMVEWERPTLRLSPKEAQLIRFLFF